MAPFANCILSTIQISSFHDLVLIEILAEVPTIAPHEAKIICNDSFFSEPFIQLQTSKIERADSLSVKLNRNNNHSLSLMKARGVYQLDRVMQ